MMSLEEIIEQAEALSSEEVSQLIKSLVDMLAKSSQPPIKQHNLIELAGLGAEIWEGIDAQEYVNQLRSE
jgi:hypothetical protein